MMIEPTSPMAQMMPGAPVAPAPENKDVQFMQRLKGLLPAMNTNQADPMMNPPAMDLPTALEIIEQQKRLIMELQKKSGGDSTEKDIGGLSA